MTLFLVIPTLTAGGAERVMSLLANQWATHPNVQVHLMLLSDEKPFYELDNRVIVHKMGFPVRPSLFKRLTGFVDLCYKIRSTVQKHKPDFVLSFMNKYNVFTILSLLGTNRDVIVSERGSPSKKIPKFREKMRDLTYKYAAGVITQTNSGKLFIEEKTGSKNVDVIPNPIKAIPVVPYEGREKLIVNVGRLVELKGQKYLLDAFSRLQHPDWKLAIIGEGPLMQDLQQQAINLKIAERVIFTGKIKDVDSWLNRASIFAFPSLSEGFPNALAEAMSAGLPCVSFDCETGPSELIKDGENGFLVDVKDTDTLTAKLNQLMDDETLRSRLSKEARKVGHLLSVEKIADDFLKFCLKSKSESL